MIKIFIQSNKKTNQDKFSQAVLKLPFGESLRNKLLDISNADHAVSSLGAYTALSRLVKNAEEYSDLEIARTENGKPYFKNAPTTKFSLSHSGDISVAAVEKNTCNDIGVDIEFFNTKIDHQKISKRFFKEPTSSAEDFFALWTAKEAYTKMKDITFSQSLSQNVPSEICKLFKLQIREKTAYLSICSETLRNNIDIEILSACEEITVDELQN